MRAEGVFGDSELVAEERPRPREADMPLNSDEIEGELEGWMGRLVCVDEDLMLRVWRRIVADEGAVSDLLSDGFLSELHKAINERLQVPADTNPVFLARALVECSDTNRLLPFSDKSSVRDGDVIRVLGSVSSVRGITDGWVLRVRGRDSLFIVRFTANAFLGGQPSGMQAAEVLILALVCDARKLELSGIAMSVRASV